MHGNAIPNNIVRLIKDRRALLWVCQRYDLLPGEEPHNYDLPENETSLRYRPLPNEIDLKLASHYWEAIWIEGAGSPFLESLRNTEKIKASELRRSVVVLAGEADANAELSSQEFLPVSVLPGLLEKSVPLSAQYAALRPKARERVAWDLSARLKLYPGRALIVLGAQKETDLARIYDTLADNPIADLHTLIVWPQGVTFPPPPENPSVEFIIWTGAEENFCDALKECGAPLASDLPKWAIRIGKRTISLSADKVTRLINRFVLITENDLFPAQKFDMDDLLDFLAGKLESWIAYSIGLPINRSYTSDENRSLPDEIKHALKRLASEDDKLRTIVIQLPCDGGSGATTMLRSAGFQAASAGYPTLILKPDQIEIDFEDILAFSTNLTEEAISAKIGDMPPMIIIFDVEHSAIARIRQLPQALAAQGRRAVIIQAIYNEETKAPSRTNRWIRLTPFLAEATYDEVKLCAEHFKEVALKWKLPIEIPPVDQWKSFEEAMRWSTPSGTQAAKTFFWVALRFFITEGMDFTLGVQAKDALGQWIEKRAKRVEDPRMQQAVDFIAGLSTFRIVCPLWTLLRPITGGTFTTEIIRALREIGDIVEWGAFNREIEDQVLWFSHPEFAKEYLRRHGIINESQIINLLSPLINGLSAGHPGDMWVAESIAINVLAPRQHISTADMEWRLDAFNKIPPVIRDQSKAILHHWARCLYKSADTKDSMLISNSEKKERLEISIEKLKRATDLPRRPGRDEHPSHLYNTLGTAYYRYANFLMKEIGPPQKEISKVWDEAYRAFKHAIDLSGGSNIEAYFSFSHRLLSRAETFSDYSEESVRDIASALSLLDEAEDIIQLSSNPDPSWVYNLNQYRTRALSLISGDAAQEYLQQLIDSENAELGYYCFARRAVHHEINDDNITKALEVLNTAENSGVTLRWRSLLFQLFLLRSHSERCYEFSLMLSRYQALDRDPDFVPRPIDQFRHAVMCYQIGNFNEGNERFRKLRMQSRRSENPPLYVREIWRDVDNPIIPRRTHVRVVRIITEWRAEGYIDDLNQMVRLRPRHFTPPPKEGEIVGCIIRFEFNGPLAVPERFVGGKN